MTCTLRKSTKQQTQSLKNENREQRTGGVRSSICVQQYVTLTIVKESRENLMDVSGESSAIGPLGVTTGAVTTQGCNVCQGDKSLAEVLQATAYRTHRPGGNTQAHIYTQRMGGCEVFHTRRFEVEEVSI